MPTPWTDYAYIALREEREGQPLWHCVAGPYESLEEAEDDLDEQRQHFPDQELRAVWPDEPGVKIPPELQMKE